MKGLYRLVHHQYHYHYYDSAAAEYGVGEGHLQ